MVSLVPFLDENARRQPDQLAYVVGDDSLQIAYSAGAPLLNRVRTEFGRMFGCRVLDCYGITEAVGNLCDAPLRRPARAVLRCAVRARGHPLGATGVAQVVEVTRHLAGRTGSLGHRPDAGLTHCTGGGISGYDHAVCTIHILTATESATHGQAVTFRAIADGTLPR